MIGVIRKIRIFQLFPLIKIFCIHKWLFEVSKANILFTQITVEKTKKSIRAFINYDLMEKKLICRKKRSKTSLFFCNKKNLYIPNLL